MWSRRTFIQRMGVAGSTGLIGAMTGQLWVRATAPAEIDRKLVTIVHSNAWWTRLLRPTNMNEPAEQWIFPEALAPLQSIRERITLLEGLYNPYGGLHGAYGSILNVQPNPGDKFSIGGISIDRFIATNLPSSMPFSSINIGYPYSTTQAYGNASADGESAPYPAFSNPQEIINQLFGGAEAAENREFIERQLSQRLSILDTSVDDINRMRSRLAAEERAQMDQYLDSVRELEQQMADLLEVECSVPTWDDPDVPSGRQINADLAQFYYDAAAIALECGLTNVLTIAWEGVGSEPGQPTHDFEPVNVTDSSHDTIQHPMNGLDNDGSDASWEEREVHVARIRRIYNWRSSMVSDFVDRLGVTDLGGYTTADRTLVMWLNSGGWRHHNGAGNIPLMFIGNPDGVLQTGRYERFGDNERCISDAFTTAARAMGLEVDEFGDPDHSRGPLPGSLS